MIIVRRARERPDFNSSHVVHSGIIQQRNRAVSCAIKDQQRRILVVIPAPQGAIQLGITLCGAYRIRARRQTDIYIDKHDGIRRRTVSKNTIENCRVKGKILIEGKDIYAPEVDAVDLRRWVGMVFQKPNPFPKSIYDNVAYGPRIHNQCRNKAELDALVEECLKKAGLFEEVKDRLHEPGTSLSGGQQQRLCIARTIAVNPTVILMDEPCSALDPIATAKIEELIDALRERFTIVIVTHSMQQAARISQKTAFFHMGKLVEMGDTGRIFTNPMLQQTQDYITGRYG